MADVIFVLVVVGFFGLMVLLVKACDHIIGPDDTSAAPPPVTVGADAPPDIPADVSAATGSELP